MVLMRMVKHSQSSQTSKFAMFLQYLQKRVRDEVELHAHFNTLGIRVSYNVILSILMEIIKHSQSTQNNKFALSSQYIKKEVIDGVHFMQAFFFFYGSGQTCPKYSK